MVGRLSAIMMSLSNSQKIIKIGISDGFHVNAGDAGDNCSFLLLLS